jgi:integrase
MPRQPKPPAYCRHKASGQAVAYVRRKPCYLGVYGSPESHEAYARLVADWRASHASAETTPLAPPAPTGPLLTINELLLRYFLFAKRYYVDELGGRTHEYDNMRYAAKPLRALFGSTAVREFGPKALKLVRDHLVAENRLCRNVINHRVNRIRRIFKWAVAEELAPAGVYQALQAVTPLMPGRTTARESEGVKSVAQEHVDAILADVAPQVAAMIRLQQLAGMRPQEVVQMRLCDIDRSEEIWIYSPVQHKNRWRGERRRIYLGPQAQAVLAPYLNRPAEQYLVSPREAEAGRNANRRKARRTPMTPSQARRRPKPRPKRQKRDRYDVHSYRRAVTYGIAKANKRRSLAGEPIIPGWSPLQLRHSRATEIRKLYGIEAAQLVLGHKRADVTQVYAERDEARALEIIKKFG